MGEPGRRPMDRIETARTILRPYVAADAVAAFKWFGDPEVMRLDPCGPDRSVADTQARLESYVDHQRQHGFSKWIVLDRADGRPIGHAGLMLLGSTGEVELGYRLLRSEWGKGIATEVSRAWLDFGRQHLRLNRIIAFTHRENDRSLAVMERLGMHFIRTMRLSAADAARVHTSPHESERLDSLLDVVVFELDFNRRSGER